MSALAVCTIVARNYLPSARVLARSVRRHHPLAEITVLVVDAHAGLDPDLDRDLFQTMTLADIGLGDQLLREMAGCYSVRELSTAVKPWLLERLLKNGSAAVMYLDPDIEVHAPLDGLRALAAEHGLILTPHVLRPFPRDGRITEESNILAAGMFNLGFIGVGTGAMESGFLRFWKERLTRESVVDPMEMLFTDQRWVDFVHCFPHYVVNDTACNVAYWNVWGRTIAREGTTILVDGRPLRFFHYSGFNPRLPQILSVHQGGGRARVLLSEHPILAELCQSYADALFAEGYERYLAIPYGWGSTASGIRLDGPSRDAYRAALLAADAGNEPSPPGPFDRDGGRAFEEWLASPVGVTSMPRYLRELWSSQTDLQSGFSQAPTLRSAAEAFVWWARHEADPRADAARRHLSRHFSQLEEVTESQAPPARRGLNFLGYLNAEDGVGEVARLLMQSAGAVGLPFGAQSSKLTPSSLGHDVGGDIGRPWAWDVNVVCVNADQLSENLALHPQYSKENRSSAGVWFWEAEVFPERFWPAFEHVDEVWAPSAFVADALEATGQGPVGRVPIPVPVPRWQTSLSRKDLGLPEGFLVLYVYSWNSVGKRKNPDGLIEAYCKAFSASDGANLVLKSVGGGMHLEELEALRLSIDRPDVHIVDGPLRRNHLKAMLEHCDCFASLHRSEGFGLTMAEAMALGKPVVATAWSGNLDFMDENVAHMIPADLVPIPSDVPVYGGLGRWAEPDIDAACESLRRVYEDPTGARALGARARSHMLETRSPERTGRLLTAHADRLHKKRAG